MLKYLQMKSVEGVISVVSELFYKHNLIILEENNVILSFNCDLCEFEFLIKIHM